MKHLISVFIFFLFLIQVSYAQWLSNYEYRKPITIDEANITDGADLVNFPFLVSLTDNDLKSVSFSGKVESSNGYDIAFAASDGTLLPHELESYDEQTGSIAAWVNLNTLSTTTNTVFYIYYGKTGVVSNPSSTSAWNSDFGGSWHFSDLNDGTSNNYTLTDNNSVDTTGKIARARYVDGTGAQSLEVNEAAIASTGYFAISFWFNPSSTTGTILDFSSGSAAGDPYFYISHTNSLVRFAFESANDADVNFTYNTTITQGTWYHVLVVGQHNGNDHRIFFNGNQVASNSTTVDSKSNNLNNGKIGTYNTTYGSGQGRYAGRIDALWIYNALPSDEWVEAMHSNQNNPGSFSSLGSEECNAFGAAGSIYGASQVETGTIVNLSLSGYNQSASLQWQVSTDGSSFSDIIGATSNSYTTPAIAQTTYYRVTASVNGCTDVSAIHTIFLSDVFLADYYYRKPITISNSIVCGVSDLSNFPLHLTFTDADLATAANKVADPNGYDIVFTLEDGTTLLDHQLEKFNSATGEISVWVRIPTLSSSSNTVILMNYGNCTVNSDQSSNTVWNANYEAVYHLGSNLNDLSQNSNNLTNTSTTVTSGITGDARSFNGTSQYLTGTDIDLTQGTISAWVKFTNNHNTSSSQTRPVFNKWQDNSNQFTLLFAGTDNSYNDDGKFYFKIEGSGTFGRETSTQSSWLAGTWYYISGSFGTTQSIGINGQIVSSATRTNSLSENANIMIGGGDVDQTSGSFEYFQGVIDEVHITNTVRSEDWLCTEYQNISSPSSYISLGTEESNFQWSGASSSSWSDGANWSGCLVPLSTSDVVIPSSATNFPVITSNQTTNSLTIESGATLTINGATLSLTGDLNVDGTYSCSSGKLKFTGNSTQNIFGSGTINICDLEINNSATGNNLILNTPIEIIDSLVLRDGIIVSTSTDNLTLRAGSATNGGKTTTYIDGPVSKIGNTDFNFPVGRNNVYGEIQVSDFNGATITDKFTAEYFREEHPSSFQDSSSYGGANNGLFNVSTIEYWDLSRDLGAASCNMALTWRGGNSAISNLSEITIAHYSSLDNWDTVSATVTGSLDSGVVASKSRVSSFSPFTFGSKGENNPLPVDLLYFRATSKKQTVALEWETASELNNDYFEVLRSEDGEEFETLKEVIGQGTKNTNTKYVEEDEKPLPGVAYYKLKQVDFDGKFTYSEIESVRFEDLNVFFNIYPNPTSGEEINLNLKSENIQGSVTIEIQSMQGKKLFNETFRVDSDSDTFLTLYLSQMRLSPGPYNLIIKSDEIFEGQVFYVK